MEALSRTTLLSLAALLALACLLAMPDSATARNPDGLQAHGHGRYLAEDHGHNDDHDNDDDHDHDHDHDDDDDNDDDDRDHDHDHDDDDGDHHHPKPSCVSHMKYSSKLEEYSEKYAESVKGDGKTAVYYTDKEKERVCEYTNGVVRAIHSKEGEKIVYRAVLGHDYKGFSYNDAVCKLYDNVKKCHNCPPYGKSCAYPLTHYGCEKVRFYKTNEVSVVCHFSDKYHY